MRGGLARGRGERVQIKVHSPSSLFVSLWMESSSQRLTVLHYIGYDADAGGIISAVRALASTELFDCVLGVNPNFEQLRQPPLPTMEFPRVAGDRLNLSTLWKTRAVAKQVSAWLRADPNRRFHAHSRAGLAVAWWLRKDVRSQTVVSVHCFGRQRWFYRASARHFGTRLFWLNPAMRAYYKIAGQDWAQCIPSSVTANPTVKRRTRVADAPVVFGGIGVFLPLKGWHWVLDAFAQLSPELLQRARFAHLGGVDGTAPSQEYEARLRVHPLVTSSPQFVTWHGRQASSESFLQQIDCLIVASENEGLSLAMIEALQAGVPVLRADSGGALEVIEADRNGWIFRSGDVFDLAAHLWRLLTTDALDRTVFLPAAIERFSAGRVAAEWLSVYERSER